jgi:outer membrane lipoprotein SlyB
VEAKVEAVSIKEKRRSLLGALVGAATVMTITKAAGGDTKQAVAAGVAGGAAGAIIGSQLKAGDGCIEKNAPIRITLRSDLTMRAM